jgi:malate dehydrogenase (oxaloacetate-decarboxylating)(NADP+)
MSIPDIVIDGEIQADFALNPEMLKVSVKLAGKSKHFNIPNLDSANITYKLLKELK